MTPSRASRHLYATLLSGMTLAGTLHLGSAQSAAPASSAKGKLHLLPATLETTQWGWFNNAQPPVLRVHSGDSIVMETMMHSHNQVVPGRTIEEIKKMRTD